MKHQAMALYSVLAVAAMTFAQPNLAATAAATPRPIVLKAARLFDAVSGRLQEHAVVIVSGNKIQAVGSDLQIPDNAQIIDLGRDRKSVV